MKSILKKVSHAVPYASYASLLLPGLAFAQIECRSGIVRNTTVEGSIKVSLRQYTANELCISETERECRQTLKEEFENDPEAIQKLAQALQKAGYGESAEFIARASIAEVVDALLSSEPVMMTVKDKKTVKVGYSNFVHYQAMSLRRGESSYEFYPNLEWEFGNRRAHAFRLARGGGITRNLDEILSFAQQGNFSIATHSEWYTGKDWVGPTVYSAIVGDQLVITLQKGLGKLVKTMTYPIPMGTKLDIPFTSKKKMRGLDVISDATFSIECRDK